MSIVPVFIFTNTQRFGDWLCLRLQVKKTRKRGGLVYMNTRKLYALLRKLMPVHYTSSARRGARYPAVYAKRKTAARIVVS
jgi:hypothetical protein